MENSIILRKNNKIVARTIEDEIVLIPISQTAKEMNYIYTLNKPASEVWNLINGKRAIKDIKKIILKKFDVTPDEVDKEIKTLIKDLKQVNAVLETGSNRKNKI